MVNYYHGVGLTVPQNIKAVIAIGEFITDRNHYFPILVYEPVTIVPSLTHLYGLAYNQASRIVELWDIALFIIPGGLEPVVVKGKIPVILINERNPDLLVSIYAATVSLVLADKGQAIISEFTGCYIYRLDDPKTGLFIFVAEQIIFTPHRHDLFLPVQVHLQRKTQYNPYDALIQNEWSINYLIFRTNIIPKNACQYIGDPPC